MMPQSVRSYMRADERQWVMLLEEPQGIRLVEIVELWEAPQPIPGDYNYLHYPTVLANRPFTTLAEALTHVRHHYPWADVEAA